MDRIRGVLLTDGWHAVEPGTFEVTNASRYIRSGEAPAHDGPEGMATWTHEG